MKSRYLAVPEASADLVEAKLRAVIAVAIRHAGGRVPLLAGTGAMTTAEAIRLSKYSEDAGADGILMTR